MNVLKYYSTNCTLTMVQMANFVCILPTAAPLLPTTHAHTEGRITTQLLSPSAHSILIGSSPWLVTI